MYVCMYGYYIMYDSALMYTYHTQIHTDTYPWHKFFMYRKYTCKIVHGYDDTIIYIYTYIYIYIYIYIYDMFIRARVKKLPFERNLCLHTGHICTYMHINTHLHYLLIGTRVKVVL
jgi:hypothetical protein